MEKGCRVNAAYVSPHMAGRVLITQLSGHSSKTGVQASRTGVSITPIPESHVISKILLKAVVGKLKSSSKTSKKDPKTFVLCNINTAIVIS